MWHPVPYAPYPYPNGSGLPAGHIAHRPVVKVELIRGTDKISCYAIVDSGADHCVFPLSFAAVLGLSHLGQTPFNTAGVGGTGVPMYYWDIQMNLGPTTIDVLAGFTEGMNTLGMGLLGEFGFFDRFKVLFDHPAKLFHIEIP